ncbi:MAG: 4-hydroxy-3-methylbut-2-enyl diphosphate reductase [Coriobacteriia bacterium]|nr:4-hydroxy-3-methylbut-2-enyl diphosphate reductase [Coriobacteriia bacterium]
MIVKIAEHAGACYGVERALKMVLNTAQELQDDCQNGAQNNTMHTLGPLIHNPQVVASLEKQGVHVAHSAQDVQEGTVVIRTHGVPPNIIEELNAKHLDIIDATCPYVKKVHKAAKKLALEGYFILIVGDADHAEVEGISGYSGTRFAIVKSLEDLKALDLPNKLGVVVQTTQSQSILQELVGYLISHASEVRVYNTICEATEERQKAAAELSRTVDVMIVIGGKNSGNTKRLFEISKEYCEHTYHIEVADELKLSWFEGVSTVGVTAGASTPASQIDNVVKVLESIA